MLPTCINNGCLRPVTNSGHRLRPVCWACHKAGYGARPFDQGIVPFRKGLCSNVDGHLGFRCYINWESVVRDGFKIKTHIDHKDGNHYNNHPSNCEELCETCHSEKGRRNGDYRGYRYAA